MNTTLRFLIALLTAASLLATTTHAEDKKKKNEKKNEAPEQQKDDGQVVTVRLSNFTGRPVELIWLNPNGSQQSYGQVPSMNPGDPQATFQTYKGHQWLFLSRGKVVQSFTANNKREQSVTIGQPQAVQVPQIPQVVETTPPRRITRGVVVPSQTTTGTQDASNLPPSNRGDATPQDAAEFLRIHNDARARVGVPPLRWSNSLARYAQQWATQLASSGQFRHRDPSTSSYGENLFGGSDGGPADAARYWLEEKRAYGGGPITPQNFGTVGHYTQMVWRGSTEVGYGIARGRNGVVIVANYSPAGNRSGEKPY